MRTVDYPTVVGISEARYLGSGPQRLVTGELLLYYSHETENAPHTLGIALLMSRIQINTKSTNWWGSTRLSDHHGILQGKGKEGLVMSMTFIKCHARST